MSPNVRSPIGRGAVTRLRTLLAATDAGEATGAVLRAAVALRPDARIPIQVIRALPWPDSTQPGRPLPGPSLAEVPDVLSARSALEAEIRAAGLDGANFEVHARRGRPFRVIGAGAQDVGANLILLGRHEPRRRFDGLLGSTAERVVRAGVLPCLLVNAPLERRPRRILVGSDFSRHAARALETAVVWAAQWAMGRGQGEAEAGEPDGAAGAGDTEPEAQSAPLEVRVVHVADFQRPGYRPVDGLGELENQVRLLGERIGPSVHISAREVSFPLAAEGLLAEAEHFRPDLLFLGSHGTGQALKSLLGSVTSEVVRTFPLPVVVVPRRSRG